MVFLTGSCVSEAGEAARIMLGISESPVFLSARAVSETEIQFQFSKPVTVTSLYFSPRIQPESVENGSTVRVSFSGGPRPGERVTADLLAEDEDGNTIHVLVPLRARNDRMPPLRITELRTEFSRPRAEFIEMETLGAGNLGAMRLFIASNPRAPLAYEFPSIEVSAGERMTLHLRTLDEESRDELGDDLDESVGTDASPTARDLWVPGSTKLLRRTDIVYILDQDDRVIDAVVLSENADHLWRGSHFVDAAEFLFGQGAWGSADGASIRPSDAVQTAGTTVTRTINRDESLEENSRSAADWYITVTSGATPGRPNDPRRHNSN